MRLIIVGPFLSHNAGWVISQGEVLSELLETNGHDVRCTSRFPNRYARLADTIGSLLSWRKWGEAIIIMVYSGPAFTFADIASQIAKKSLIPIIFWLHGGNLPDFYAHNKQRVSRVFGRGKCVIAPSVYLAQLFQGRFETQIIPNMITLENYVFYLRHSVQPRLLWMRTFHELYNPAMAVEVLACLKMSYPQAILTMAGQDKGLLQSTKRLVLLHGLDKFVRFPGFLDLSCKQYEFANHDIFLNTNHIDNMPISLIEAGAFGLPVISTNVGGIPYFITDEEDALLVPKDDINAMTHAVKRVIERPELAESLSLNGRKLAETFSKHEVLSRWQYVLTQFHNNA